MSVAQIPLTLEIVISWARSGNEWDKVYRFLFIHPEDLFTIPNGRTWSIAHQIVYHGNVDLLKRILALYSDDHINIRTLSNDRKTLLDVAKERQTAHPVIYTYMEHLFLQDELIQAAKQSNWRSVTDSLEKNHSLANEKPPYSTYFLLHYVVQNANKKILEDFRRRFQFQTNVLSADNETALDIAKRLRKDDMYSLLESTTQDRSQSNPFKFRPLPQPRSLVNTTNDRQRSSVPVTSSIPPSVPATTSSLACPYPTTDPFPRPKLSNFSVDINGNGSFVLEPQSPFTSIWSELPPSKQQQSTITLVQNTHAAATISNKNPGTKSESTPITPITSASKAQLLKNLTCPLTNEIFRDPVVASDGQTYEREAITEWIRLYRCSPTTGATMNATFVENTDIKNIIQSMKTLR